MPRREPTQLILQRHACCNCNSRFKITNRLSCTQARTCLQQLAGREKAATQAGGCYKCLYTKWYCCCDVPMCKMELSAFPDQQHLKAAPASGHTSSTALLNEQPAPYTGSCCLYMTILRHLSQAGSCTQLLATVMGLKPGCTAGQHRWFHMSQLEARAGSMWTHASTRHLLLLF